MSNPLSMLDAESQLVPTQDLAPVPPPSNSEQFLRLQLAPSTDALLPIVQMAEVLTIPAGQIVPIPHMPPWVVGVHNWRGEILWVVDLGHLCGLTPRHEKTTNISAHKAFVLRVQDSNTTVAQAKSQTLGIVVDQIKGIEWCDIAMIQALPMSNVAPKMANFLRGYWWKSDDDMLAVLDGAAIFKAMSR